MEVALLCAETRGLRSGWLGGREPGFGRVLAQIPLECVAFPPTHGLYHLEWYASEQVLEGATDAKAVALEVGKIVGGGDTLDPFDEFALGQRCEGLPAVDLVGEQVGIRWCHVDTPMILECVPGIGWPRLSGPGG